MKTVEEKITHSLNVSPEQAWKVIGSVGGVDQWFGSMIKSCQVDGDKRYCETTNGDQLEENILEVNHETRTFRFGIPKQDMLPVEDIKETMQVRDGENGKTVVEWSASFLTTDENAPIAKEAFRNLWKMGLNEMESYITNQD